MLGVFRICAGRADPSHKETIDEFVKVVKELYPWKTNNRVSFTKRRPKSVDYVRPIIHISGAVDPPDIPADIRRRTKSGPAAHCSLEPLRDSPLGHQGIEPEVGLVAAILRELRALLGSYRVGMGKRRNRLHRLRKFPRSELLGWLMEQEPMPEDELREMLHRRDVFGGINRLPEDLGVWWITIPIKVLRVLLPAFLDRRISGTYPHLSGSAYRWFVEDSQWEKNDFKDDFLALASRFVGTLHNGTTWRNRSEDIPSLLVRAFVADVRDAYRSRQRTACCTILLSEVSDQNRGKILLKHLRDERKKAREPVGKQTPDLGDPFLIIAQGGEPLDSSTSVSVKELSGKCKGEANYVYVDLGK